MDFNSIFFYSGIIFWIGLIFYAVLNLFSRINLLKKLSSVFVFGPRLKNSIDTFIKEFPDDLRKSTISDLVYAITARITRVITIPIIIGVFLGLVPYYFLYQQNTLISQQNRLFEQQNKMFNQQNELVSKELPLLSTQNDLLKNQNEKIDEELLLIKKQNQFSALQTLSLADQNSLLKDQNNLIYLQANLVESQNELISSQNDLAEQNLSLIDASRISSYRELLIDLIRKVQVEIGKSELNELEKSIAISEELLNEIQTISYTFTPYRVFHNGIMTTNPVSPERGLLWTYLSLSNLDRITLGRLSEKVNLNHADFSSFNSLSKNNLIINHTREWNEETRQFEDNRDSSIFITQRLPRLVFFDSIEISKGYFVGAEFNGHSFLYAKLYECDFKESILKGCDFTNAYLNRVVFSDANLSSSIFDNVLFRDVDFHNTDLSNCSFSNSNGLNYDILSQVKSLRNCKGLPKSLEDELRKKKPDIFE